MKLCLLWHMHQPDYRPPGRPGFQSMPWVRLHAARDYFDMPALLAGLRRTKATINMVPVLADQVLESASGAEDPLFRACRKAPSDLSRDERLLLLRLAFLVPVETTIDPVPRYRELKARADAAHGEPERLLRSFRDADLLDLEVLYHLAWTGISLRHEDEIAELRRRGRDFSLADRDFLLERQRQRAGEVMPLLRALQDEGRLEVSTTPYCHPILPLLCDLNSASRSRTGCDVGGTSFEHPEDAAAQVERGLQRLEALLGRRPRGIWPSEGALSEGALLVLGRAGVAWTASDEQVLRRSLRHERPARGTSAAALAHGPLPNLRPWRVPGGPAIFFRDTALSDRIGFHYATRTAAQAAQDFLSQLRARARGWRGPGEPIVPVILDGENCWEHYPDLGEEFLRRFYDRLEEARDVEAVTLSEALASAEADGGGVAELRGLRPGSWIHGTLDTWAGHPEKNRAWALLAAARQALGNVENTSESARLRIQSAEGSDWFWWLGDDHPTAFLDEFDALFREHLRGAWTAMGLRPPAELDRPIHSPRPGETAHGGGPKASAVRPPAGPIEPRVDGAGLSWLQWLLAGTWEADAEPGGAMRRGELPLLRRIRFGWDAEHVYVRLEAAEGSARDALGGARVQLHGETDGQPWEARSRGEAGDAGTVEGVLDLLGPPGAGAPAGSARFACGRVWEAALPRQLLGIGERGGKVGLRVEIVPAARDGEPLRFPLSGPLWMELPEPGAEGGPWSVGA